jgi:hypothetical protein
MLELFSKYSKTNKIEVVFRDEQKSMLGLFLKFWKPINLSCFRNLRKPNVDVFSKGFRNH